MKSNFTFFISSPPNLMLGGKMKIFTYLIILIFYCSCNNISNKSKNITGYTIHTIAISVKNLENSLKWYNEILDCKEIKRRDFPNDGLYTALIGNSEFQLELIEKRGSLPISNFLSDSAQPTLIQGFKKVVFKVNDIDSLFSILKKKKVTFVYPEINETKGIWGRWFMIEDLDGNIYQIIDGKL